jgi:hypothetical protein
MKRFLVTVALTATLTISVSAGDMHTGDSPAPLPSGTPQVITLSGPTLIPHSPGDMHGSDSLRPVDSALSAFLAVFGLVV